MLANSERARGSDPARACASRWRPGGNRRMSPGGLDVTLAGLGIPPMVPGIRLLGVIG
jgi:hypothetical protein